MCIRDSLETPVKEETLTPPVNIYQTATLADTFVGQRPDWLWSPEQVKTITSPPVLMVPDTQWDYWEVLSGSAVFTQLMTSNSYICGPPVDYNTGWNLSRKDHQKAILTLLGKHQPVVLWITLPHTTGRTFTHKETQLINFLRKWQNNKFIIIDMFSLKDLTLFLSGITNQFLV